MTLTCVYYTKSWCKHLVGKVGEITRVPNIQKKYLYNIYLLKKYPKHIISFFLKKFTMHAAYMKYCSIELVDFMYYTTKNKNQYPIINIVDQILI